MDSVIREIIDVIRGIIGLEPRQPQPVPVPVRVQRASELSSEDETAIESDESIDAEAPSVGDASPGIA